jgi:hypothetical protein
MNIPPKLKRVARRAASLRFHPELFLTEVATAFARSYETTDDVPIKVRLKKSLRKATVDALSHALSLVFYCRDNSDESVTLARGAPLLNPFPDVAGFRELVPFLQKGTRINGLTTSMLLYGPPGTGKTYIVQVLKQYATTHLDMQCSVSPVEASWFGRPSWARFQSDTDVLRIYLIDEIDTLLSPPDAEAKGSGNSSTSDREMILRKALDDLSQGVADQSGGPVIVLATTNYPERLSEQLKRPGRFDYSIECLPWNQEKASAYVRHCLSRYPDAIPIALSMVREMGENGVTEYRAAELGLLCKEALLK